MRPFRLKGVIAVAAGLLSTAAHALDQISIALPSKSLAAAGPRLAKEVGAFERQGIDPSFVYIDSTTGTAAAVISRSVQFGVSGPTEVILARQRGQSPVIVVSAYNGLSGSLVLQSSVASKSGVSQGAPVADRLKALSGLTIAATSPTSTFATSYRGASNALGANPRFTYMAMSAMPAALESGAIQGFVASSPIWPVPVAKGSAVLWIDASKAEMAKEYLPITMGVLVTMKDYAESNADLIRRVRAAFDDLAEALEHRPADVKSALARLFPELDEAAIALMFSEASIALKARRLTGPDIAHEAAFMKLGGIQFNEGGFEPTSVLLP